MHDHTNVKFINHLSQLIHPKDGGSRSRRNIANITTTKSGYLNKDPSFPENRPVKKKLRRDGLIFSKLEEIEGEELIGKCLNSHFNKN